MGTRRGLDRLATAAPWIEHGLAGAALLALAMLPVIEMILRTFFHTGIPDSSGVIQHLTLWVGFLGAMVAAGERRHLTLSTGVGFFPPGLQTVVTGFQAMVSTAVACGLFWACLQFVRAEMASPASIAGGVPLWAVKSILPAALAVIALRFVAQAGGSAARALAFLGIPLAGAIGFLLVPYAGQLLWPGMACLLAVALLGAPIYVVLGGAALLLFFADGVPVASIPVETYRIAVSPSIPTIPLFTLTGYVAAPRDTSG